MAISEKKRIAVLGSTGSVGVSTLDVLSLHPEQYSVYALTANTNVDVMEAQCLQTQPKIAVMVDKEAALQLQQRLAGKVKTEVLAGEQALIKLVKGSEIDAVMVAIVGAIGLQPSLAAVQQGKQVLIANKEPLVMAGELFMQAAETSGATILPIDSEHNAIFQCLPYPFERRQDVRRLILTASGGPFRGKNWNSLVDITPAEAIAHPNWSMGPKISVDSATMMNKGLELIEASHLFGLSSDKIDILIHPQSIIHSLVEYLDGSQLAQLGSPDMKIPIAHALAWPNRIDSGAQPLDLVTAGNLQFEAPNMEQIPCLRLARQAAIDGGVMPAVMNAANEIAVDQFIKQNIGFTQIPELIDKVLQSVPNESISDINHLLELDTLARKMALSIAQSVT